MAGVAQDMGGDLRAVYSDSNGMSDFEVIK